MATQRRQVVALTPRLMGLAPTEHRPGNGRRRGGRLGLGTRGTTSTDASHAQRTRPIGAGKHDLRSSANGRRHEHVQRPDDLETVVRKGERLGLPGGSIGSSSRRGPAAPSATPEDPRGGCLCRRHRRRERSLFVPYCERHDRDPAARRHRGLPKPKLVRAVTEHTPFA